MAWKSPDCNPVERFWAWLRKRLRAMDLKDAVAKRLVLGKSVYKARVRNLLSFKAGTSCCEQSRQISEGRLQNNPPEEGRGVW